MGIAGADRDSGTIGDLLNTIGMKHHGEVCDFRPSAILRLVASLARNPYLAGGILAMAVSFFALMALLSIPNLSFAVPATASGYILETALAKYILKEKDRVATLGGRVAGWLWGATGGDVGTVGRPTGFQAPL